VGDTIVGVITGLGPVIHAFIFTVASINVDGRNKSGHDEMRDVGSELKFARKLLELCSGAAWG
jgi:hypothetical protein